jgi:stage IV sporulation protein FB
MRDPFSWSLPLGRMFGITIRLHILFPVLIVVLWLKVATGKDYREGAALQLLIVLGLLFISVLLHEFGHCFGARLVDGEANEVLLWPLGGLANCEVPHTPRANFICAAAGPLTNVLLCVITGAILAFCSLRPSFDPRIDQLWATELYNWHEGRFFGSEYAAAHLPQLEYWQVLLARFFWLNWIGVLINVLIIGFPLDGGRMFQALLWPRLGYRQAMVWAIFVGFVFMFIIAVYALVNNELLVLFLAWFIYQSCKQQWILLETGAEDTLFGYDFSQGYTSLERDQPPPPRKKRPNFFQRWLQRRRAAKLQREQERAAAEEQRMDELLEKIQREGRQSLTDEENRFLKRVADKYRNRP